MALTQDEKRMLRQYAVSLAPEGLDAQIEQRLKDTAVLNDAQARALIAQVRAEMMAQLDAALGYANERRQQLLARRADLNP